MTNQQCVQTNVLHYDPCYDLTGHTHLEYSGVSFHRYVNSPVRHFIVYSVTLPVGIRQDVMDMGDGFWDAQLFG